MIHSRITGNAQTIPQQVLDALGLREGDDLVYEVDGDQVTLRRYNPADPFDNPFLTFTEWNSEADRVYDQLAVRFPAKGKRPA